ncbi:MAG: MMPL family transporter [Actinobacteria bacterium]|nr:MMPL family transporter [Actinomycetota bacterium]
MQIMFATIGRFAVRFRWAVVAAWVAAAVLASVFFPSLTSVARQSNADTLPAGSPSLQAARMATPFQGLNQSPIIVVVARSSGAMTPADVAATGQLAARLARVADVQQVKNLGASADRQAVLLQVLAKIDLATSGPAQRLVSELRQAVQASSLPQDLNAHLAGQLAAQTDASHASDQTATLGLDLSIVFIAVLLLLVFRSLLAPLLTLAPAVVVSQLAGPVIGEATKAGLHVTSLTNIMMLILTLGAGTDYGLFLVFRVREELRAGRERRDAVVHALSRVGESITFSAATVIAALLTLLLAAFGPYTSLGAPLAIAIALMLAAGLTLQPALLAIFGRAAFWPSRTARGTGRMGWWGRTASRIVARPAATLVLGLLAFGVMAGLAAGYTPAGFGATPAAPHGSDTAAGDRLLTAHFPAASGNPTSVLLRWNTPVWTNPDALATAQRRLAQLPEFSSLVGALRLNGAVVTPGELADLHTESQFISPDGRTVLFNAALTAGDPGSNAALRQVPRIRADVAAVARAVGATASGVAGEAPATYDVSQVSDHDLQRIIPVAIVAIGILLAVVLRSLIAPLYLIASVVLSYLAALGLSVLIFQDAARRGGLLYFLPFLLFVFLLALGEDYNILVMSRIREEAGRVTVRQAVIRALESTGSTVTSAGLVLAGTFGVFAVAVGRQPGSGVYTSVLATLAIGILMDAFAVRTLLVPATVALLGRWNWWPSTRGADEPAHRQVSENPPRTQPVSASLTDEGCG